jgi:hypothetical protein
VTKVRLLAIALVFCLSCKKPDPVAEQAKELLPVAEAVRDTLCGCKDRACAEAVDPELDRVKKAAYGGGPELTRALAKATECRLRLVPPPPPVEKPKPAAITDARERVGELKDRMCKCPDRDCARLVVGELTRLRAGFGSGQIGEDDPRALHDSYIELVRCMSLAQDGGGAVLEKSGSGSGG